jgi:hypothetical protein
LLAGGPIQANTCSLDSPTHLNARPEQPELVASHPLARLAEAGEPVSGPCQHLCGIGAGAESRDKKDVVWFALNQDRLLSPSPANGAVEPIHQKAMPAIL